MTMTLRELAIACDVYQGITGDDRDYLEFRRTTNHSPDLSIPEHRQALLKWLRRWGCRQFAVRYSDLASREIQSWWEECSARLPPVDRNLWDIEESEVSSAGAAFSALSARTASRRGKKRQIVRVGPTGAAKILFAVRPKAMVPWDGSIRATLGYGGDSLAYVRFLEDLKAELTRLSEACRRGRFDLAKMPVRLGYRHATVPKLIDQYYWVTITRGQELPDAATLERWVQWARLDS